jgi:hypothetical protein
MAPAADIIGQYWVPPAGQTNHVRAAALVLICIALFLFFYAAGFVDAHLRPVRASSTAWSTAAA